jgi:hypothetical protein
MNTRNEILASIDAIDMIVTESSLDVLFSVADTYEKSSMILENYCGNDLDAFAIFQEAVNEGDPDKDMNANAKKNDSILMKIIMFPVNILKKLWEFIKQAWNGVIVPQAVNVSEKSSNLFEKIIGKDESWIKEHAKELGIAGGATLSAVLGLVGFLKRNEIKDLINGWLAAVKSFFENIKTTGEFYFDGKNITTSIKTKGFIETFKSLKDTLIVAAKLPETRTVGEMSAHYSKYIEAYTKLKNVNFTDDNASMYECKTFVEFLEDFDKLQKDFNEQKIVYDADTILKKLLESAPDEKTKDELKKKGQIFGKLHAAAVNVWQKTTNVFKSLFEKIKNLFKKVDEVDKQLANEYGLSDSEEPSENDKPATDDLIDHQKSDSIDDDQKEPKKELENSDTDGKSAVDPDVRKQAVREYNVQVKKAKSKEDKLKLRQQIADKYGIPVDKFFHEFAAELDDDDNDVVQESVSSWYRR